MKTLKQSTFESGDMLSLVKDTGDTMTLELGFSPEQQLGGKRLLAGLYVCLGHEEYGGYIEASEIGLGRNLFLSGDRFMVITVKEIWVLRRDEPRPAPDATEKRGTRLLPC